MPKFRVTEKAGRFFRHHGRAYLPGAIVEMSVDTAAGFPRELEEVKRSESVRQLVSKSVTEKLKR